jgi:hypothetical protein
MSIITWLNDELENGIFKNPLWADYSKQQGIYICLEDISLKDYAEKCVNHFCTLPNNMINNICSAIIRCIEKFGGINEDFNLSNLKNPKDILKYCWFTTMYIENPLEDETQIGYSIEGESDWGEVVQIAIKDNSILYVGCYDIISPWQNDDYYQSLEDNCIYL